MAAGDPAAGGGGSRGGALAGAAQRTGAPAPAAAARAGGVAKAALQEARAQNALQAGGKTELSKGGPVVAQQQQAQHQLEQQHQRQQEQSAGVIPAALDEVASDEKQVGTSAAGELSSPGAPETHIVDSWAEYGGHSSGDEVDVDASARRLLSACRAACACPGKEAAAAVSQVREAFRKMQPRELVDAVDRAGNTGLHLAARTGRVELFRALYAHSPAMLGAENLDRLSPLDLAAHSGCLALVLLAHELDREAVEQEHRARDYFGCTTCGQLLAGRGRFQLTSCDKGREHRWAAGAEPPRHIVALRAPDFVAAVAVIKSELGRASPRRGWWCKPQGPEQPSPLPPLPNTLAK